MDQLRQEYHDLLKLRQERFEKEKYRYFVSTGKFEEFTNKAMSGNYTVSLLEAANGIGKTFGMANLLANLFWPVGNKYFQQSLFQNWPFPKKGRIISYPNTVIETIIPTLKAVFPQGMYQNDMKYNTTKEGKRYEAYWKTNTGWEFSIMTYDQDVTEFESANLGFFWEDEPPSYAIHQANYSRLRMGGVGFVTETPLKGSQWIFDEFTNKMPSELDKEKKSVTLAVAEDACKEHGVRGFVDHKRILDQISGYDKDEIQQRVFGKHHHLAGIIFKKWDSRNPGIHIISAFDINWRDYVVVHAWDTHPRVKEALLWVAIDREGRHFMVDELWIDGDTKEVVPRVKAIDDKYRMVKRIIEPAAFNVDKRTGYCLAADLKTTYNLDYEAGSKLRELAVRKIRDAIDYTMVNDEIVSPPHLYCFDTLERAPWEMARWQWQDWRGLTAQFKNPKEKPVDKDDHMIEDLGRILLADVKFEEMYVPQTVPDWALGRDVGKPSKKLDPFA